VPALRERAADIPLLVEHFAAGTTVTPEAMARLTEHPWPGNVRELRNVIERALTLRGASVIDVGDLEPAIGVREGGARLPAGLRPDVSLREVERAYILSVMERTGGNKSRAAEILGLDRKTLYRKLDEFGDRQPGAAPSADDAGA
jgi:DNA-binding NtrC family response regulator